MKVHIPICIRKTYIHWKQGRVAGARLKLPAFIKAERAQLTSSYLRLTPADKEHLRDNVKALRNSRAKITRANPRALQKDINATFNAMHTEVLE